MAQKNGLLIQNFAGRVKAFIRQNTLAEEGDKILIAFSGGPDSVFLYHMLKIAAHDLHFEIALCHVNHQLRGEESERDEQFCKQFAEDEGIQIFSERADVTGYCSQYKVSIEMGARKLRYKILNETAGNNGFNRIATGHNSDDNAETFIMSVLWGSRIGGLSGIPVKNGKIIRPLLNISGSEIRELLMSESLDFITDSSNSDSSFRRNKIRNELLPLMKKMNQGLLKNINQRIEYFSSLRSQNEKNARRISEKMVEPAVNGLLKIRKKLLQGYGDLVYDEIIKYSIKKYFNVNLSFVNLKLIRGLQKLDTGKEIQITGGIRIINDREFLRIMHLKQSREFSVSFYPGSAVRFPGGTILSEITGKFEKSDDRNKETIALRNMEPLMVRNLRDGDTFRPIGMRGRQKVHDFATNLKLARDQKENLKLLVQGEDVIWIIGHRISEDFKVRTDSQKILKLTFLPDE